ncbi:MAG: MFS family permease/MFS family permease [Chloroflexi bacterium]|jgi:EmrB/QacA subfamily drug resistance transporter|nr:MAG: MFS family permease/MFS family permease [Chloroflexota bacterium]
MISNSVKRNPFGNRVSYKWWVLFAVSVGLFTSVFDYGGMNVALPSIAHHFNTDLPTTQWIVIGYGLTIAALLLPMGRLSDILGRKIIYLVGFIVFTIGGFLAAMSLNIELLIGAKILQGVGSAMTQGTSMAMVISAFGDRDRGRALGLTMSVIGIGAVVGPATGGFLVDYLGWESVLYTTTCLGVVSLIAAMFILDTTRSGGGNGANDHFDWLGATFSAATLISLLLAITLGSRYGWGSLSVITAFGIFFVSAGFFIWWELYVESPMLDLRLFGTSLFATGVLASWLSFLGTQPVRFLIPFYLQFVLGFSPSAIGWIIVPSAFCMVIAGPVSGRLSDRYGWRTFNVGGMLVAAIGLLILVNLDVKESLMVVLVGMVVQTLGSGIFWPSNNSSILSVISPTSYGVISSFTNLVRNSGNVVGIAVSTAIVTETMGSLGHPATLSAINEASDLSILGAFTTGLRNTFWVCIVLTLMAAAASLVGTAKKN